MKLPVAFTLFDVPFSRSRLFRPIALAVPFALAACASGGDIAPQSRLVDAQDLPAGSELGATRADAAGADASTAWWTAFGDPQLDQLVTQALGNSPSLRVAQARVRQAQAARVAQHQQRAEPALQLGHCAGDGRGRHPQRARRPGEALRFGHGGEDGHLLDAIQRAVLGGVAAPGSLPGRALPSTTSATPPRITPIAATSGQVTCSSRNSAPRPTATTGFT